jgi:hypothetical protein
MPEQTLLPFISKIKKVDYSSDEDIKKHYVDVYGDDHVFKDGLIPSFCKLAFFHHNFISRISFPALLYMIKQWRWRLSFYWHP